MKTQNPYNVAWSCFSKHRLDSWYNSGNTSLSDKFVTSRALAPMTRPHWLLNTPSPYIMSPPDFDSAVLGSRI